MEKISERAGGRSDDPQHSLRLNVIAFNIARIPPLIWPAIPHPRILDFGGGGSKCRDRWAQNSLWGRAKECIVRGTLPQIAPPNNAIRPREFCRGLRGQSRFATEATVQIADPLRAIEADAHCRSYPFLPRAQSPGPVGFPSVCRPVIRSYWWFKMAQLNRGMGRPASTYPEAAMEGAIPTTGGAPRV